jgi:hypothetical protein
MVWNSEMGGVTSPAASITMIDECEVEYSQKWLTEELADPIKVTAGWHRVGAWIYTTRKNAHYSEFDFKFKAGHAYSIRHADDMDWRARVVDETAGKSYRIFKDSQFTLGNIIQNRRSIMPPRNTEAVKSAAASAGAKSPTKSKEKKPTPAALPKDTSVAVVPVAENAEASER